MFDMSLAKRDSDFIINTVREIRITHVNTPSSFDAQLIDEDLAYRELEIEMYDFYSLSYILCYCKQIHTMVFQETDLSELCRLSLNELKPNMFIATKIMGKWRRCLTENNDPRRCRLIDDGAILTLLQLNEDIGIYPLHQQFCNMPPRVILCGLGYVIPTSPRGYFWSYRACELFKLITETRTVKAFFIERGLPSNAMYVFITTVGYDGGILHVNTMLVAFDTAILNHIGMQHPITYDDIPC